MMMIVVGNIVPMCVCEPFVSWGLIGNVDARSIFTFQQQPQIQAQPQQQH